MVNDGLFVGEFVTKADDWRGTAIIASSLGRYEPAGSSLITVDGLHRDFRPMGPIFSLSCLCQPFL